VELFAGGAALFFMRPPAEVEVINDVNGELVNLYRVVKNHLEEFVRQFKYGLSSRQVFKWMQSTPSETLTDIQLEFPRRVRVVDRGCRTESLRYTHQLRSSPCVPWAFAVDARSARSEPGPARPLQWARTTSAPGERSRFGGAGVGAVRGTA
jgi:hypothetical protein